MGPYFTLVSSPVPQFRQASLATSMRRTRPHPESRRGRGPAARRYRHLPTNEANTLMRRGRRGEARDCDQSFPAQRLAMNARGRGCGPRAQGRCGAWRRGDTLSYTPRQAWPGPRAAWSGRGSRGSVFRSSGVVGVARCSAALPPRPANSPSENVFEAGGWASVTLA